MTVVLEVTGLLAAAALFGSMAFFSGVVAPLTFIKLDSATAGRFIRGMFPWYYLVVGALSLVAACSLAAMRPLEASLMGLIALGALASRQILMPRINRHRDRMATGEPGAASAFERLHRLSVWINGVQVLGAFLILVLMGIG